MQIILGKLWKIPHPQQGISNYQGKFEKSIDLPPMGWPVAMKMPVVARDRVSQQGCLGEEEAIFQGALLLE